MGVPPPRGLQPSQEKLKTMLMQNFGGANKVHYGRLKWRIAKNIWLLILVVTLPYVCPPELEKEGKGGFGRQRIGLGG